MLYLVISDSSFYSIHVIIGKSLNSFCIKYDFMKYEEILSKRIYKAKVNGGGIILIPVYILLNPGYYFTKR